MKTISALFFILTLTSCSLFPTNYDNNEYELLARLETNVALINENCDDATFVKSRLFELEYDTKLLHTYTYYIPNNTEVYQIVDILSQDVVEFSHQYEKGDATPTYCKLKTRFFLDKVRTTLEAVGQKPRG